MKGIMFINFLKPVLSIYLSICLVSATKDKNDNNANTTTTTTAKPFDLSGVETRHFESSVPVLHPGESLSRSHSHSYSRSTQHYVQQNPGYGGESSEHGDSKEQFYNNGGNNYHNHEGEQRAHPPQDIYYFNSHEAQQQYHGNDRKNYKEPTEQKNNHPYSDHGVKSQTPYGYHQESYGSTKEENQDGGRPLFHYAYEISTDPQHQQHYDIADVPNSAEKATYGSTESEDYAPKTQQVEYYPKPKAIRYIHEDVHKEGYKSEEKANYFPDIPKEAGYVTNVQKEHEYLQNPHKEPSYPKTAGYSPRNNEPSAFLPILSKQKNVGPANDAKVAVFIKHLGHKAPGTNQYVNKERQGFLLLPVVHHKTDEKLKELSGKSRTEHKQGYQDNKQTNFRQGSVGKKHDHVQTKVVHYPVNAKVATYHHVPAYNVEEEPAKSPVKTTVSHSNYHIARPVYKHTSGRNAEYKSAEAYNDKYTEDDKSDGGPAPYIPQSEAEYGKQTAEKAYSAGVLAYGRSHLPPSLTADIKSEPASLYAKEPEYASHYDVNSPHKPSTIKIKDFHPSFSSIYHAQGYPRIVDLSLTTNKNKKNAQVSSRSYSPSAGGSPHYQNPTLKAPDHEKSFLEFLQKPDETEIAGFKPSSYTSRGRISAKGLVEGFGLHDYESLLSKPSHGGNLDSLYYDLHSFPAEHIYTRYHYPRPHAKLIV